MVIKFWCSCQPTRTDYWKGPYDIQGIVGVNDYKMNVRGKWKTYHVNMLKKFYQRERTACADTEVTLEAGSTVLEIVGAAILKANDNSMDGAVDDDDLLFLETCHTTESKRCDVLRQFD